MTIRLIFSCALLVIATIVALPTRAQTYVIPFSEIRQQSDESGEAPDRVIEDWLIGLIRNELDALGFDVDAGLVLDNLPLEAMTEIIETDCDFYRPYEVHTDATTATVIIDESSSLTVSLDTIRSVNLQANLAGTVSADTSAWVRWGQDIPFVGDCIKIDTDHGDIGITLPFDITLELALQLTPTFDAEQLAIVVDKQATLTGQSVVGNGSLRHDFGLISLTDLVLNIFEDRLLEDISENSEQQIADEIVALNFRLDGRDANGDPDPTIEAFNGPSIFFLDIDDEDRASVRQLLAQYGIPDVVLDIIDERGVEILLTLATLTGPERELYLAELGAQASCDVLLAAFRTPLAATPIYRLNGQDCEAADVAAPSAGPFFSDSLCLDELAYEATDNEAFCAERFGAEAETLLGNAAAWVADDSQPNDPLPGVPSRPWTTIPGTELDVGVLSIAGNRQPYMKRFRYKTIEGLPRGSGSCELEMRVYKSDVTADGLVPLIALHGGTWRSRGFSFFGLESGLSQLTERGFIVFAPFYRLVDTSDGNVECNGASWREVTADAASALDWVLANGAALGAAEGAVSIYGQSAGGHLAAWLAAHRPDDVRSALVFYGPTDALEFLAGAVPVGGPYEAYRDFGLRSLARFFGARNGDSEVRLEQIAPQDFTVARIRDDWADTIPDAVFDLSAVDAANPPAYVARCAADLGLELGQIDLLAPPPALLGCLKRELRDFLVDNSLNHQFAGEPAPVHVVQGSADSLVPYTQALNLCGAIDGSVLPTTVADPLTSYDCGQASQVQIVWGGEHALELGVCLDAVCPAGEIDSLTRDAAVAAIGAAWDWLQADPSLPNEPATAYADVPESYWAFAFIEALAASGISSSCSPGNYCPDDAMIRSHMAVFLERAMRGGDYQPPPATGIPFADVGPADFAADFIEQLYADGITSGCGGGNYCPAAQVRRDQMAVFLLRAKYGAAYSPPPATGIFSDVATGYWAARWIEQLAAEGITGGCGGGRYCPSAVVTRAQMAVFLARAFELL